MTGLSNIVVVLVEPESPGNVGFAARAMVNFGVKRMRIVGVDPRHEEQARVFSKHAVEVLDTAEIFPDLRSALTGVLVSWAATARSGGPNSVSRVVVPLDQLPDPTRFAGDVALVFGRESSGLKNEEVDLCDLAFTIPVSGEYPSMNLSHAIAVVLYDFFTRYANREPARTRARPATREQRERATMYFSDAVDRLLLREHRKGIAKRVFINLLGRVFLSAREAMTLIGTMRKIRDALDSIAQED
ncbi:MAG: TrmJ/YjtD family RNA methyltransferase [Candidatus Thorarchaeota archaeon]|nr:TrmJ/YjtD family RNA methyltransferase [Candidatus Thorarchaeota archaeon]